MPNTNIGPCLKKLQLPKLGALLRHSVVNVGQFNVHFAPPIQHFRICCCIVFSLEINMTTMRIVMMMMMIQCRCRLQDPLPRSDPVSV